MRKSNILFGFLALITVSCGTQKELAGEKPLYEVMYQDDYAGAAIQFFEIVTESKEFKMLLNDEKLKRKINPDDIKTSNFLILNLGEKSSGGYAIGVEKVEETTDNILVTVKEVSPKPGENITFAMTYPMCIVKINSKKEVIFK